MNFRGASAWLLGLLLFSFLEPANCRGTSLLHLFQEILDLRRAQNPELTVRSNYPDLNIAGRDLPFVSFFQSQNCSMDGIIKLHIFCVPLLKKCLCIGHIFPHCWCFPGEVWSWWIYLIQLGSIVIIPSYQQRYTKWSYTAATNRVIIKMSKNKNYRQHRNQLLVRPRIQKKQITKIYTGTTCNCNWSVSGIFSVYSS